MNKANGDDGIPVELFQIVKDDAVSAALNMPGNLKTPQWSQDWKRSVFISIQKKGNVKECSNTLCAVAQLLAFHMLARLCSKSFKLGFSSM